MAFNSFQKSRFKQFSPCFVRYERDEKDKKNGNFSIQKSGYQSPMKTHGIKKRNGLKTKRKSRPGCLAKSCVQESCFRHRRQKKPRHCFPDVLSHSNLPGCMQRTKVQSRVQKLSLTLFTSDFYRSQVKSLPHLTLNLFLFWIIFKCKSGVGRRSGKFDRPRWQKWWQSGLIKHLETRFSRCRTGNLYFWTMDWINAITQNL